MKKLNLRPTFDDFRAAVTREYGEKAATRLDRCARRVAWERLVAENRRATDAELALLKTVTGPAWLQVQHRISALFAEHSRLMEIVGSTAESSEGVV